MRFRFTFTFLSLLVVAFFQEAQAETPIDLVEYYKQEFSHLSGHEIQALNKKELNDLQLMRSPKVLDNNKVGWLTRQEAQVISDWMNSHSVISYDKITKYDPERKIGFCFGRAMAVHLELIARGVSKDAIRKVFITPSMGLDHFHVVTVVRGPAGVWWAFELNSQPMPLTEWVARWGERVGTKMKVHITDPSKFAGQAGKYNRLQFADGQGVDGYYRNYFLDFLKSYRASLKTKAKFAGAVNHCARAYN